MEHSEGKICECFGLDPQGERMNLSRQGYLFSDDNSPCQPWAEENRVKHVTRDEQLIMMRPITQTITSPFGNLSCASKAYSALNTNHLLRWQRAHFASQARTSP